MNKRLGWALAAYLAIWVSVAAGIIYGIILAGYPTWVAVVCAVLVFVLGNGSIAYTFRARRSRLEGKEPPPYFMYLFFPQGFDKSGGDNSIIGQSGQLWKLWGSYGAGFVGAVAAAPFFWNMVIGRTALSANWIFVVLVLSASGLWCGLLLSIVCPVCNARWFKIALGGKAIEGMNSMERWTACPSCGQSSEQLAVIAKRKP